jgi:hypothetical protein
LTARSAGGKGSCKKTEQSVPVRRQEIILLFETEKRSQRLSQTKNKISTFWNSVTISDVNVFLGTTPEKEKDVERQECERVGRSNIGKDVRVGIIHLVRDKV